MNPMNESGRGVVEVLYACGCTVTSEVNIIPPDFGYHLRTTSEEDCEDCAWRKSRGRLQQDNGI